MRLFCDQEYILFTLFIIKLVNFYAVCTEIFFPQFLLFEEKRPYYPTFVDRKTHPQVTQCDGYYIPGSVTKK